MARSARGAWVAIVVAGTLAVAGCGGGKGSSSSTTGASATQAVKRLEVTVVRSTAAAETPRAFLVRAAELLSWARSAEAATCTVSAAGQSVSTDVSGKAILLNVPVDATGNIPVTIDCDGIQSTVNVSGAPGSVVAVTVEVGPGKVEVKARNEHVSPPKTGQLGDPSQPSQPSKPSKPTQTTSTTSTGGSKSGKN